MCFMVPQLEGVLGKGLLDGALRGSLQKVWHPLEGAATLVDDQPLYWHSCWSWSSSASAGTP